MGDFKTTCPRCGASEEDACLEVVYAEVSLSRVFLQEDGFALSDCESMDTTNELVKCHACNWTFPLSECMNSD